MSDPCSVCKGACCETFVIPWTLTWQYDAPYLNVRGRRQASGDLELPAACPELELGRCRIYADRPAVCRDYAIGGEGCRSAIHRRRTPREARAILEAIGGGNPGLT